MSTVCCRQQMRERASERSSLSTANARLPKWTFVCSRQQIRECASEHRLLSTAHPRMCQRVAFTVDSTWLTGEACHCLLATWRIHIQKSIATAGEFTRQQFCYFGPQVFARNQVCEKNMFIQMMFHICHTHCRQLVRAGESWGEPIFCSHSLSARNCCLQLSPAVCRCLPLPGPSFS